MSEGPSDPEQPREEPVGSAAEEAAKLLGSLGDWARENLGEHLATGAPECTYCPICRTVHVVREASPEVRVHLASAAASLMQAAAAVLNAVATPPRSSARGPEVEKIDLDDNGADDGWPDPEEDR
ncbi:hypothetical protein [Nocardioides sp. KR10-350]|uniref:hypothetical protein n=1 Tax=Nocardioides cheoyonin TaxID=3156615 RepID=UPI0032B62050